MLMSNLLFYTQMSDNFFIARPMPPLCPVMSQPGRNSIIYTRNTHVNEIVYFSSSFALTTRCHTHNMG